VRADAAFLRAKRYEIARRRFLLVLAGTGSVALGHVPDLPPIVIDVNALMDQGAHSGRGLTVNERSRFQQLQGLAEREFAATGIRFNVRVVEGAFLRTQGYSEIPDRFLARGAINLFVTEALAYDIDRDRTGGCSVGPSPRRTGSPPDPFYKTFLGLRDARETTLVHEYAHHFSLDTRRSPTTAGNFWSDLRNDYWLWRQRRGVPILQFRACVNSEWAHVVTLGVH
jgi:hypothetical protein